MREQAVAAAAASGQRVGTGSLNSLQHNAAVASHTLKYPYAVPELNPVATQAAAVAAMAAIPAHDEAVPFGREAPYDNGNMSCYGDLTPDP